jgi:hypothetical protein
MSALQKCGRKLTAPANNLTACRGPLNLRRLTMAKDEKKTIVVNDVEYNVADLTEQQIAMVNHVSDLDRKLANARFNVDQLPGCVCGDVNRLT